jgi:hypothetical protein
MVPNKPRKRPIGVQGTVDGEKEGFGRKGESKLAKPCEEL